MHAVLSPASPTDPPTTAPAGSVLTPLDGSTPRRLTLWTGEAEAAAEHARSGGCVYEVEDVLGGAPDGAVVACASLTEFGGPRDAVQVAADRVSSQRIWAAVSQVPGAVGGIVLRAPDGAMAVLALADTPATLEACVRTLLSTPLLPGEDPALLTGPDSAVDCRITGSGLLELLRQGVSA